MAKAKLIDTPKSILRAYHQLSFCFGLAYGIYSMYAFIFLNTRLREIDRDFQNPLEFLLTVLALSMLFEVIAEPLTGNFADNHGRRIAVVWAFLLMVLAFVLYGSIASIALSSTTWIVVLASLAELALAFGLAFHSGSLDAWFVDAYRRARETKDDDLEPYFARNSQYFAGGVLIGGVVGLYLSRSSNLTPWIVAAAVAAFTCLTASNVMHENADDFEASKVNGHERGILSRLLETVRTPGVFNLTVTTSACYMVAMVLLFFGPLFSEVLFTNNFRYLRIATDLGISSNNPKDLLFLLPFVLTLPRLVGPSVALLASRLVQDPVLRLRVLGLGAAILLVGAGALGSDAVGFPALCCLLLLVISWVLVQAGRTGQTAYMNELITDNSIRAFALSMSTVLGALVIAIFVLVLIALEDYTPWANVDKTKPVAYLSPVFITVGVVSLIGVILGTRRKRATMPAPNSDKRVGSDKG
jgi:MFS family permease